MHELGDQSLAALDDFLVGKRRLSQGSECKAQTKGIIEITKCGCESWKALLDDVIIVKNGFGFEQGLHLDVIPFCSGMIHFPQECLVFSKFSDQRFLGQKNDVLQMVINSVLSAAALVCLLNMLWLSWINSF